MNPNVEPKKSYVDEQAAVDAARHCLYQLFYALVSDPSPNAPELLSASGFAQEAAAAGAFLRDEPAAQPEHLAPGELSPQSLDIGELLGFFSANRGNLLEEHQQVFGLVASKECPQYETEYCPQTFSIYRSHHLADIAGFYRAFGLEPSPKMPERPDHIALELEFMAWLITKEYHARNSNRPDAEERVQICRDTQKKFFEDHIAWWVPAFCYALRRKADGLENKRELNSKPKSLYGALGYALAAFVPAERAFLNIEPPTELVSPQPEDDSCSFESDCSSDQANI